ncbi:MAG: TonB-dependent receptor [Chitinophagaceae bacterium]|nr:TonB-dependent receptor [Chitinophagaceae bacterium]
MQHVLLQKVKHACALVMILCITATGIFAQSIAVRGKVADDKGEPLANATVVVKGTKNGTTSNDLGEFNINVPGPKSVLIISAVGHQPLEITVGNQTFIDAKLVVGEGAQLESVVVVGYATQKKVTVTGAVAQVKGTELQKSPAVNLSNSLAGRLPGVIATNSSGEPGYDGSTIRIRGVNSLGNNSALIVIDGVPARAGGLDRLNPADIESMSVLKDASAAIYGARAANGVILITTKRGKTGKPQLSYSFNQGWGQPTTIPKVLDAVDYATMANEIEVYKLPSDEWAAATQAFKTTGQYTDNSGALKTAPFQPADIEKYADGSDPWGHPSTDWFKATLRNWAPQSRHNVQLSGGSENVKYMASLGYQNQQGQYINSATGYKQYDFRINLDAKVNKYITTTLGVTARQENRFFPTKSAGSIFRMLMRGYPYRPAYWPNGLPGPDIENGEQPVVITTNQTGYDKDTRYYLQSNGRIEVKIPGVEGLKVTGNVALDKYIRQGKTWITPWYIYAWDYTSYDADGNPVLQKVQKGPTTQPTLNQYTEDQLNAMLEGILSYEHKFGDHQVTFLAGVTKETSNSSFFNAYRQYFPSRAIDQLNAGGAVDQKSGGSAWERARLNYFGRVGYNYLERYIVEFLWRYDGSYNFPEDKRFGFFPGVSAGWRISEENFFKNNITFINALKLRGSWGQLGNDAVYVGDNLVEYSYLPTYAITSSGYVINNQVATAYHENGIPNPAITWEVANNYGIGLDASFWNNKFNLELDYFQNRRSSILWFRNASIPQSAGLTLPAENIGRVANKGWEFKLGYNDQFGDLRFNVSVNGGYARNKILFWDETPGRPPYQWSTGHPIPNNVFDPDAMLLYQYDGVFKDQKDVDANKLDYSGVGGAGKLFPGSMKFKDVNNDGNIDAKDRVRSDKTVTPRFQGGLNIGLQYKNFDLSVLFQNASGGEVFLMTESGTIGNYLQYTYDHRWTVDNPSSVDPRTVDRNNQYFSNRNTYYMMNTNYVRLKNVEIGYNLPETIGKRVGINNLRLYVNGLNLVTWADQNIFDPEAVNSSLQYYPQSRIINAGVTVTF